MFSSLVGTKLIPNFPLNSLSAYYQLSRIRNEATHKWTSENAAGLDVLKRVVNDGFSKLLHEVVREKHGA